MDEVPALLCPSCLPCLAGIAPGGLLNRTCLLLGRGQGLVQILDRLESIGRPCLMPFFPATSHRSGSS